MFWTRPQTSDRGLTKHSLLLFGASNLGDKKRAYRRNGIREYIVWQVFEQKLDWFRMHEGEYVPLPMDEDGVIRSQVFPGLWLAANDLLARNMRRVFAVLQAGLAAPEHDALVQGLEK